MKIFHAIIFFFLSVNCFASNDVAYQLIVTPTVESERLSPLTIVVKAGKSATVEVESKNQILKLVFLATPGDENSVLVVASLDVEVGGKTRNLSAPAMTVTPGVASSSVIGDQYGIENGLEITLTEVKQEMFLESGDNNCDVENADPVKLASSKASCRVGCCCRICQDGSRNTLRCCGALFCSACGSQCSPP